MHRIFHRFWCVAVLFAVAGLSGCCTRDCAVASARPAPAAPAPLYPTPLMDLAAPAPDAVHHSVPDAVADTAAEIRAGAGDVLTVQVAGEADLSGDYPVGATGRVALPLVGSVGVGGMTAAEAAEAVAAAYRNGYLVRPQVQVTIRKGGM